MKYLKRKFWTIIAKWQYRKQDENLCCCGCDIGKGGDICYHGGCRSAKEYAITCLLKEKIGD